MRAPRPDSRGYSIRCLLAAAWRWTVVPLCWAALLLGSLTGRFTGPRLYASAAGLLMVECLVEVLLARAKREGKGATATRHESDMGCP